jgi:hypothetical protein
MTKRREKHTSLNRPTGTIVSDLPSSAVRHPVRTATELLAELLVEAHHSRPSAWVEMDRIYRHVSSGVAAARRALEANAETAYAEALEVAYVDLGGTYRIYLRINPDRMRVDGPDPRD